MDAKAKPPLCPACSQTMTLARTIGKKGADLALNVFECRPRRVSYTVAQDQEDRRGP